ncbi:MAG: hypothetical protein IT187_03920 [Geothrix sp.]|jgi:hypothetical protein|uniref:Uncharacterized protein n=1 Tax=Candidatus Geothrix odensensis TaxID=2954440 RepID=A0A936K796_9BACT|nr:hypothetical protein [Candidatus Geothrix odensensis]MCC6513134.1 hypothetical protein [Geothrix sp.]
MITGYNTDVRHGNRVFHVQTEDKGLSNPKIETLIYVGGEILDSYRSSYEDLTVAPPVTESVIQSRMDEQHRAVIRDIKNGKYDLTPPDLLEQQAFNDRPLDQAILEFLQQEGDVDTLELVLDQPLKPAFGSLFKVQVRARLCQSQSPVSGAEVSVKLVSSLKKATGLLSGKTGVDGSYEGEVQLPPSQPGQCAVVVTCSSDQGFDEVKTTILAS